MPYDPFSQPRIHYPSPKERMLEHKNAIATATRKAFYKYAGRNHR